jgi:hypothetical protein
VSTREVKKILKDAIEAEDKRKAPHRRRADRPAEEQGLQHRPPDRGQVPRAAGTAGGPPAQDILIMRLVARWVSIALHPLFMPLYTLLLAFALDFHLSFFLAPRLLMLPWVGEVVVRDQHLLFGLVFVMTVLFPSPARSSSSVAVWSMT